MTTIASALARLDDAEPAAKVAGGVRHHRPGPGHRRRCCAPTSTGSTRRSSGSPATVDTIVDARRSRMGVVDQEGPEAAQRRLRGRPRHQRHRGRRATTRPTGRLDGADDLAGRPGRATSHQILTGRRDDRSLTLLSHPQPVPGRLAPRAVPDPRPTRCASSSASSPRSGSASKRWVARGGTPGRGRRHRPLGGPVRARRRPALPRDHRPRPLLRRGQEPDRARSTIWQRRPRHLGRDRARRRSAPGHRLPAARGSCSPPLADALAPGIAARPGDRPVRQLLQPGALRPAHRPAVGPGDRPGAPARAATAQYATFHPTFLYEALWNLGASPCCSGPTGGSGSATAGCSRST